MADIDQEQPAGRKRPEFARAFTARLQRPGTKVNLPGRVLTAGLVVVLAGAVAFGVGAFINHKKTVPTSANSTGQRTTISPTPGTTVTPPGGSPRVSPGAPVAGLPPKGGSPGVAPAPGTNSSPGPTAGQARSQPGAVAAQRRSGPARTARIQSFASNRCIDVVDGRRSAGTALQIWDCNTFAQQRWEFWSDGTLRVMGFCMAVGGSQDGATLRIQGCNGGAAQRFNLNGAYDLVNIAADKCVDVKDHQTGNGARLQLWSCSGEANQKWRTV
jgi:hypothetical protein